MYTETVNYLLSLDNPYLIDKKVKKKLLFDELSLLDKHHYQSCCEYRAIVDALNLSRYFLPVRLFKLLELKSIPRQTLFKTLTSSGTTSQAVSKIFLDKATAELQTKALVHIMQSFLGKQRLPMLIIDHPNVIKDRVNFSARGAGILGLSTFGREHIYALHNDMTINFDAIDVFLGKHGNQKILIFGFTFMIWQYFVQQLIQKGRKLDLAQSILIHSGGWKKLQDQAVSNEQFKLKLKEVCNLNQVHNFYGMVEQVGSIFVECEQGYLHCPHFSDIQFLNLHSMTAVQQGQTGVVAIESIIPQSYPGHRILTEDKGYMIGEDNCACGRKGKYFVITGRLPKAELRGCSDTYGK